METILSDLMLAPDKIEFFFDSGLSVICLGCGVGFAFGFLAVVFYISLFALISVCVCKGVSWLYRVIKFYVKEHPKSEEEVS